MLKLVPTSTLGYKSRGLAISGSHVISDTNIQEVISTVYQAYGCAPFWTIIAAHAASVVPYQKPAKYLCWVEGTPFPKFEHATQSEAVTEAKRLCQKTGKPVRVITHHSTASANIVVNVEKRA